eukprot:TRINITY_DN14070_c0_g1_i2.p1 TRINITY_DN14070_c0_g1~~TRINITY_DN14070_c0_g1_i2.p1  ORF type:complete len:104 (-),score=21.10 TRINITY_DN14070_c0_g1_i2:21-332(-)
MRENVLRCLLKLLVNRNIMRNLDNYVYRGNGAKGGEQSKREPSTQDASAKIFSQSTEATPEQPENNKRATEENTKRCNKGLSLIHICRCRRYAVCRSRWSPYH